MRSKTLAILWTAIVICGLLSASSAWERRTKRNAPPKKAHQRLIVDQDDQIWLLDGADRTLCGYAVWRSGSLDLKQIGGPNAVPYKAFRHTVRSNKSIIHAVLFAVADSENPSGCTTRFVLIRQDKNGTKILEDGEYDEVLNLIVDDINGDGKPEIVVEWSEGKVGSIDAWSIEPDGRVIEMNLDNLVVGGPLFSGRETSSLEPRYTGPGRYGIVTSEPVPSGGGWITRSAHFEWDAKKKAYVLKSVVDEQCSTTELK